MPKITQNNTGRDGTRDQSLSFFFLKLAQESLMLNFSHTDRPSPQPPLSADNLKFSTYLMKGECPKISANKKNETAYLGEPHPSQHHREQCTDITQSEAMEGRLLKSQENQRDPTVCFSLLIFKKLTFTYTKGQRR